MKKNPDIVPFEKWYEDFTDEDICELLDIEMDELDDLRNEQIKIDCPSCEGNGYIELEHEFKNEHGKIQSIQYTVDCAYCDGYPTITLDETRLQQDMKLKYTKINQRELVKYDTVFAAGTI